MPFSYTQPLATTDELCHFSFLFLSIIMNEITAYRFCAFFPVV